MHGHELHADGFGIEAEITAQIFKRNLKVYEVPISYEGREYDEGKKITWKDFFRSVDWLLRCRFENYDVGEETLYRMKMMKNNNQWLFEQIKPFLGNSVLEVGSGIGNISKFLASLNKMLVLTDIREKYLELLRRRFISNPKVKVISHNICSTNLSEISSFKIDTVLCINVLEHIRDDEAALENIHKILEKNGRLIVIVPALKTLYGSLDEKLDHFRRYEKEELVKKLEDKNFLVEKVYYHNFISAIGWFVNGHLLKKGVMSSFQISLLDKFIPFSAKVESLTEIPFGLSLIAICRKE